MKHTLTHLTALLLTPLGALHAADAPKSTPNIIIHFIDDLGCLRSGSDRGEMD